MRIETIGNATLYLGDCADILPMIGKVDVLIADPPYIMAAHGGGLGAKRKYLADIKNHLDAGFNVEMLAQFPNWFVFCGKPQLIEILTFAESIGKRWQLLTWNKNNPTPLSNNNYLPDTEYMIHGFESHHYESKTKFIVGNVERSGFDHPTVKPQYVMQKAILSASHRGETVLDCFMGTGSTGVAALGLGRKFIGIEREESYFDIACRRIEDAQRMGDMFATEIIKPVQVGLDL